MRIELLAADREEFGAAGIEPEDAFRRGVAALGSRPTHGKPREAPGTAAGVEELVHLYAEAAADMRLLRFSFATKAGDYHRSRERYDAVESSMADLKKGKVPALRARLRELRSHEAELERKLRECGRDPGRIGPRVPAETAIDPTPKPGEGDEGRRTLPPLPPRTRLLARLLGPGGRRFLPSEFRTAGRRRPRDPER
ncbi:MAG: hypothetical protein WBB74_05520 [Gaiellaceae bacterium]